MSYNPVSGAAIQYVKSNGQVADGYYLKFYIANTTTPLSMATDSAGGTTLTKCKLNDKGYPISNPLDNDSIFIPHVNQAYRFVLYQNEADADANNTANADVNIAETPLLADAEDVVLHVDSIADLPTTGLSGQRISVTGYHAGTTVGGGEFVWNASARHNGVTLFDPTRSAEIGTAAYYVDSGVDAACWERVNYEFANPEIAGAMAGASEDVNNIAAQATFNVFKSLHFQAGTFNFSTQLSVVNDQAITIRGAGLEKTNLVFNGDVVGFSVPYSGGAEGTVTIKDLTLTAVSNSTVSEAIYCSFGYKTPGLIIENVSITTNGGGGEWSKCVRVLNGSEHSFSNVICRGVDQAKMIGFLLEATLSSVSFTFHGCTVYNAATGLDANGSTVGTLEGLKIADCDFVGVSTGIKARNCSPQISIMQTHVNATYRNVDVDVCTQLDIGGGSLFYNQGSFEMVYLSNVSTFKIDLTTNPTAGGDPKSIVIDGNSINGQISGIYTMNAGSAKPAVELSANTSGVVIDGVTRLGGGYVLNDLNGTNILKSHTPADGDSVSSNVAISSGNIDLSVVKSLDYVNITSGSGTITSITPKFTGQKVMLKCDNAVTIQHNAGILLAGSVNFTFAPGGVITLYRESASWREVSRQ